MPLNKAGKIAATPLLTAVALLSLTGCSIVKEPSREVAACDATPEGNRQLVLAFFNQGLVKHQPRAAFMQYVSSDFVEHKPDIPIGTRDETVRFLEALIRENPRARWEVIRTIAEKDLVFLHTRFTPAPDAPPYAIGDIFRVKDCRIVEHWDVVSGPARVAPNPNPQF